MKKKTYHRVTISGVKQQNVEFIMLNPFEPLTVGQCNSRVFEGMEKPFSETGSVYDYFGVTVVVWEKLDRRTRKFKELERRVPYFSAMHLRGIGQI